MNSTKTLSKSNETAVELLATNRLPADSPQIIGVMVECDVSEIPSPLMARFLHWNQHQKPVIEIAFEKTKLRYLAETCISLEHLKPHDQLIIMVPHNTRVPVIMGIIQDNTKPVSSQKQPAELTLEASEKITFKCGDSKMTLQKDGKVAIRGKNVISHATHRNRVRGGSVELN